MPTAILPMESGSHGPHVHRHGRSHDAQGAFSKTSERICDKGFKVVSRAVSYQRRHGQWSLGLTDRLYIDTGVVMMREVCYQHYRSACVIRVASPVSWLISKSWFQGWSMAPGFKAGCMGGFKAVSASWFQGRFQGGFKASETLAGFHAPQKNSLKCRRIRFFVTSLGLLSGLELLIFSRSLFSEILLTLGPI